MLACEFFNRFKFILECVFIFDNSEEDVGIMLVFYDLDFEVSEVVYCRNSHRTLYSNRRGQLSESKDYFVVSALLLNFLNYFAL